MKVTKRTLTIQPQRRAFLSENLQCPGCARFYEVDVKSGFCPGAIAISRADRLCLDEILHQNEIAYLRNLFYDNGYPHWFFDKVLENYKQKKVGSATTEVDAEKQDNNDKVRTVSKQVWCKVPYIGRPSLEFRKKLTALFKGVKEL